MKFEPLYFFMNEEVVLVEVKRTDLCEETHDKSKIFHWLKITPDTGMITPLTFKSMGEEMVNDNLIHIREFAKGELRFDDHFAKFQHDQAGHIIANRPVSEIPKELEHYISQYLEKIN